MLDAGKNLEGFILEKLIEKKLITPDLAMSKKLREAILRLSDAFTRDRADLPKSYFDDELRRLAYLAGFTLTNATKVISCLEQLAHLLPKRGPLSILDVGTGPGTAVVATSSFFCDREVRFVALEKNRRVIEEARRVEALLPKNHSVDWIAGDLKNLPDGQFNLCIAANVLNELNQQDQFKICKKFIAACDNLIVIDPALKQTTRQLMVLRDQLVAASVAHVIAPCTHQLNCPMLTANERDWCHFYLEWQRPKLIDALDRATGLDHKYIKYAYLILRSSGSRLAMHGSRSWRVVSAPLKSKGKLELVVCGGGELTKLRRLDKNASETNVAFGNVRRGDLVSFTQKERPGEIRACDNFVLV